MSFQIGTKICDLE